MKLKSLQIERNQWDSKKMKDMLYGKATFTRDGGPEMEVTVSINPDKCHRIVEICADLLVESSQEMARMLVADLRPALEHQPIVPLSEPQAATPKGFR